MPQPNPYMLMLRKDAIALRFSSLASLVFLACLSVSWPLFAQEKNPYVGDAKTAKLGEYQFRLNCAFCHGLGARGGGRGPDLTRARKRHGDSDGDLFQNISQGIPGTVMPANGTNGQGVGMTD